MRTRPLIAGIVGGAVLAAGGIAVIDAATPPAEAQSSRFATKSEVNQASLQARAAINIGKRLWNLYGIYGGEPGEIVGAKDGPIRQERAQGGGLPENALSQGAQGKLNGSGSPGPQGPAGQQGPAGPQGPSNAFYREGTVSVTQDGVHDVLALSLPPGKYTAAAGLSGTGQADSNPSVQSMPCRLTTPAATGRLAWTHVTGDPTGFTSAPSLAFESSAPVTLALSCSVSAMSFTNADAWIVATEVGDLTSEPPGVFEVP